MGYFKCISCKKYGLTTLSELCDNCSTKSIIETQTKNKICFDEKLQNIKSNLEKNPQKLNEIIALLMILNNIDIKENII